MKRTLWLALIAAVGGTFVLAVGVPTTVQAGKPIHSIAADFAYFGFEAFTDNEPPVGVLPVVSSAFVPGDGLKIYQKTFNQSAKSNIVTVEMSTTGDTHDGAGGCFSCIVTDPTGARGFCNPGGQGAARCAVGGTIPVPGWITLIKEPSGHAGTNCNDGGGGTGDCHDNAISYKWCYPVPVDEEDEPITGLYTVELWMATNTLGSRAFIEQAHFYVNETKVLTTDNACVEYVNPDLGGGGPA